VKVASGSQLPGIGPGQAVILGLLVKISTEL
jgi:hypothetical protein